MDEEEYHLDEEELRELQFNIFNSDINLLSVHILLEAFYRGENILTLGNFIKGNYWKIDEISDEARDTGDFASTQDLVLSQVIHTIQNLELGKIKKISVVALGELLETVVKDAMQAKPEKDELDDMAGYYCMVIDNIHKLKKLSEDRKEEYFKNNEIDGKSWRDYHDRIDLTVDNYYRHLEAIVSLGAPFIEIEIEFSDKGMRRLEEAMDDYLFSFAEDDLIDKKPNYREKRFCFSKQLENFVAYINNFPVVNGYANIPFEALSENGFEFVKVVSVLERRKRLKVRNWGDEDLWNIKFHQTPIIIHSLASLDQEQDIWDVTENLKSDLSFSKEKGVLTIGNKQAYFRKDTVQYHLIRIIFEDPSEIGKEWFFSEIGEKYDQAEDFDDKKFANASYQAKLRINRDAGIKDFFIITKQSVTINPKYLK